MCVFCVVGSCLVLRWLGVLLFCGMSDLIFKNACTLLLKALQNGKELFLEVVVLEFSGCSPPCEGDCSIGLYEGF